MTVQCQQLACIEDIEFSTFANKTDFKGKLDFNVRCSDLLAGFATSWMSLIMFYISGYIVLKWFKFLFFCKELWMSFVSLTEVSEFSLVLSPFRYSFSFSTFNLGLVIYLK